MQKLGARGTKITQTHPGQHIPGGDVNHSVLLLDRGQAGGVGIEGFYDFKLEETENVRMRHTGQLVITCVWWLRKQKKDYECGIKIKLHAKKNTALRVFCGGSEMTPLPGSCRL